MHGAAGAASWFNFILIFFVCLSRTISVAAAWFGAIECQGQFKWYYYYYLISSDSMNNLNTYLSYKNLLLLLIDI